MKERVLFIAYDVNPELGSECGVAHSFLTIYSKHFIVDVYTGLRHEPEIINFDYGPDVNFHYIDYSRFDQYFGRFNIFLLSNWYFCKSVYRELLNQNTSKYKFMHIITPAGVFAFNKLYKLNIKYIIGPTNGGLKTPKNFEEVFKNEYFYDLIRNLIYKSITKLPVWKRYFKNADVIIHSDEQVLKIIPKSFHHKRYQIFDTLVNSELFVNDTSLAINSNSFSILYCGRLIPKKGILMLLEAFHRCVYQHNMNDITLTISGRGPLLDHINKLIIEKKIQDKVFVFNGLKRELLIKKYQEADVFCAPTLREPGGTAILEAMSCGLPVITSDYGGPSHSVTDDCGIKIKLSNYQNYIDDLTKAIIYIYQNPEVKMRMAQNARKRILDEFSKSSIEKKLQVIWSNL